MQTDLTRPIIGIENRTALEVFDIMCDRIRTAEAKLAGGEAVAAHSGNSTAPGRPFEPSALTHPAPTHNDGSGEAVAWLHRDNEDDEWSLSRGEPDICYEKRPLYTAPPASHTSGEVTEAASPVAGRVKVPNGQTPLNDDLGHRLLDVFAEGIVARKNGTSSPYHGHSLEHCLHAAGWVQCDLRMALEAALRGEAS